MVQSSLRENQHWFSLFYCIFFLNSSQAFSFAFPEYLCGQSFPVTSKCLMIFFAFLQYFCMYSITAFVAAVCLAVGVLSTIPANSIDTLL